MMALWFLLLDLGPEGSAVLPDWQLLTPQGIVAVAEGAPGQGVVWVDAPQMTTQDRSWPREVDNPSRGASEPPPVYTTEVTQDCLIGSEPVTLRVPAAPPGEYELWVCAGSSERSNAQLFDFTVAVEGTGAEEHFQIQQGYWFETRTLRFEAAGAIDITLTPRSQWIVAGMALYPVAAAEEVREDHLAPHERAIYFLPDDIAPEWTEAVHEPALAGRPAIPEADRQRGYVVHHRNYLENVYPNTPPIAQEIDPTLRAFASLGEYEPLTFSVLGLRDLAGCRVEVGDLTGPGTIPAGEVDVKLVQYAYSRPNYTVLGRYHTVPDYLRPFESVDVPAGENQRFWLTVRVPADAEPGTYEGRVTFRPGNAPEARVPIQLRVLPIRLQQDPERTYGIYYRDPLDLANTARDDASREFFERQAEIQAADMNAHGTVLCVPLSAYVSVPSDPAQAIEYTLDWEHLARRIDRCQRYGYAGPFVLSINTGGLYRRHMGESYGSHLRNAEPAPEAFEREMREMVEAIEAGRKERGLPEFLYYPVDEPGREPDPVAFMVQCLKAIRDAGAPTYVTADPTHDAFEPMRPHVNVWCTQPFLPPHDEITADMAARDVEYWCYPNHVNGENDHTVVSGARMTYGFGFWRSGFRVLIPWIYSYSAGHPYNNLDGSAQDFFNRPGPDGTVWPVPMWEAYREGYDDYRYIHTCRLLIEQARAAGKTDVAGQAQAVLDGIWEAIEVKAKYKLDEDVWGYGEFDRYRWLVAQEMLALQEAL